MIQQRSRLLSIDPAGKGFAWAILEGPERLVDWGLAEVAQENGDYLERVETLLLRYKPKALILEDPEGEGSRRSERVRKVLRQIELLAWRRRIEIRRVSRKDIREVFEESGWRKREIALAISRWFTELESWLPRRRLPWMNEDLRMSIFDAVSFALTVFRKRPRSKP